MHLPIELIPNTNPPRFRWRQWVHGITGMREVQNEGVLPPALEYAVVSLINIAKQLQTENDDLRNRVNGLADRVAAQSELLSKRAEKDTPAQTPSPAQTQPTKKGKGG